MRYVAAYLLSVLGGNNNPSKNDISKILESIGLDIEDDRLDKVRSSDEEMMGSIWVWSLIHIQVIKELDGKDINEVIAMGSSKLAQMPSGSV